MQFGRPRAASAGSGVGHPASPPVLRPHTRQPTTTRMCPPLTAICRSTRRIRFASRRTCTIGTASGARRITSTNVGRGLPCHAEVSTTTVARLQSPSVCARSTTSTWASLWAQRAPSYARWTAAIAGTACAAAHEPQASPMRPTCSPSRSTCAWVGSATRTRTTTPRLDRTWTASTSRCSICREVTSAWASTVYTGLPRLAWRAMLSG